MRTSEGAEIVRRSWLTRWAWVPIALLLLLVGVLRMADVPTAYDAPHLVMALNFVFGTLASAVILFLVSRNFLARGTPGLLLLGCGVLAWGTAGIVANTLSQGDANLDVTIHNLGVWIAALFHLGSALLLLRPRKEVRARELWLAVAYAGVLAALGLIALAALQGWTPAFFVQGTGGTLVRQFVLGSAIAVFLFTGTLFHTTNRQPLSPFAHWYALSLGSIAVGLLGILLQTTIGGLLPWAGRAALYLSGVYMLIAAAASARESAPELGGLELSLNQPRHQYALAVAAVLVATALRLLLLPALDMRVPFLTLYPAVMLAALYGGFRTGLLATVLSTLAVDFFWIPPVGFFGIGARVDWLAVGFFVVSSTLISAMAESLRRAQTKAANAEIEAQVAAERARTAEALRENQQRLTMALDASGGAMWGWNVAENRLDEWDARYRELYGFGAEEKATFDTWLARIHPDDRRRLIERTRKMLETPGDNVWDEEFRVLHPQQGERWLCGLGRCYRDATGKALRMTGVNLDVTERKQAEAVLQRGKAELEQLVAERTAKLQELVGELEHFSYTITHDMRAPLRAMRGFSELVNELCAECPGGQQRELLGRISTAAERMDLLITDALSFAKAVRNELPLAPVDVGKLLRGMLDTYPEFQTAHADIMVEKDIPLVLGNEAGLTQCFSNLLGNAVKFIEPGKKAEVRVRSEVLADGHLPHGLQADGCHDGWVRIWVEDNGVGISKELLPRVFDMFSRGTDPRVGTGIGLALVRKVVDRMGGKAGVESELGSGSRFWVELRPGDVRHTPSATSATTTRSAA